MHDFALIVPPLDPTAIFEQFRSSYATELLVAAVGEFRLFDRLALAPCAREALGQQLGLAERPTIVLTTALRAMGLLAVDSQGRYCLSPIARQHLVAGAAFDVSDYLRLAANSPGVVAMVERLRSNRPAPAAPDSSSTPWIFKAGRESAMDQVDLARHFTLALVGRAKNVAPLLARSVSLDGVDRLLDLGGGAGIYSIALLQANPRLRAIIIDRAEVLNVAAEFVERHGVGDRIELRPGDMFADELPADVDAILLSNILHDWDAPECQRLISRCAAALSIGGQLLIHDVFLSDDLDGPLPIALYSAALFCVTEGRAYSAREYREWLIAAGLAPSNELIPTLVHCAVLGAVKTGLR